MSEMVSVSCVKHVYPDRTQVNICGLDFVVKRGERVVILGPNGSGKTTLLSHILGLLKPVEGQVVVFGMNPYAEFKKVRKRVGVVFQNVEEQIIGPTVFDDIAFSLRNEGNAKEQVAERVTELARILNLEGVLHKIPHYLSGGQKKKVALAGAMSLAPELLIMDEPFDGLDPKSKAGIIEIINCLHRDKGVTTIITTHDINIVPFIADKIYVLNKGQIITGGTPEEIFAQVELLKESDLEPPILAQLFHRIRGRGAQVGLPVTLEQAENELEHLLRLRPFDNIIK